MSLISAGGMAETDGYIGYMEPYATSHQALDKDEDFQQEVVNVARALGNAAIFPCREIPESRKGPHRAQSETGEPK
jgi:hypothetical protein